MPTTTTTPRRIINVLRAGRLTYAAALRLQQSLARRCHELHATDAAAANVLVLTEHPAVYTVGLRSRAYTGAEEERLRALGADFQRTNRGGLITFHGPGQLVAYPVLHLRHFQPSIRWYVCALERTIIDMCGGGGGGGGNPPTAPASFPLPGAGTAPPNTGVWVGDRKLCAIGVHASRYVTTHGLALNCCPDLRWFEHIVPCGIEGKGVTSLSVELRRPVDVAEATEPLLRSFGRVFEADVRELEPAEALKLLAV